MRRTTFAKRGSGQLGPEDRAYTQRQFGAELGTHGKLKSDAKPKSERQVQRYKQDGKLAFTEKRRFKDRGPAVDSSIAQSLWARGEEIDIAVGSAHAGAAQKPRPNRKKRSLTDVDAPPGGETSAVDVTEISPKK